MKVCFRFDIDTPCCIDEGVPALLRLADELRVRFTFFFNPGRAVSRRALLAENRFEISAPKLSPHRKLGFKEYLRAAFLNPPLHRLSGARLLVSALEAGHEVGLHGGRNHAQWQRNAHLWSYDAVKNELEWGMNVLSGLGITELKSFSSPGWNGSRFLPDLLPKLGISVLADRHGDSVHSVKSGVDGEVAMVATGLSGEPNGVGFLETAVASNQSEFYTAELFLRELRDDLRTDKVVYDHPCFAGREALPLLRRLVKSCRIEGIEFATVGEIGEGLLRGKGCDHG